MKPYPFDPKIKHHLVVAMGLAVWIFVFLYFTQPLDVSELSDSDRLLYMPLYGSIGALCYLVSLLIQQFIYKKSNEQWTWKSELIYLVLFVAFSAIVVRSFYLYVVVAGEPNPYTLGYFLSDIYFPALITILPIVIGGRFALGKYANKKLEAKKIEIKGSGNYESLRLLWNDLIYIQSSDNYVEVTYLNSGKIKKHLIRNKLSSLENDFPDLLRTHRSYLINSYHFKSWKTENGKLAIVLSNDELTPISKTYTTAVKSAIDSTTN